MTIEMKNQLKPFEIFIEKMEGLIQEIKDDEQVVSGECKFEDFDLRNDDDGCLFSIPSTLDDYFEIWKYVQVRYDEYIKNKDNDRIPSVMYFDVYWNNTKANSAFFDEKTLWIYFSEDGLSYDE